jgi:hypothetical protein
MTLRKEHLARQRRLASCCSGDLAGRLEMQRQAETHPSRPWRRSHGYLLELRCSGDPGDRLVHLELRDLETNDFAPLPDRLEHSAARRDVRGQHLRHWCHHVDQLVAHLDHVGASCRERC